VTSAGEVIHKFRTAVAGEDFAAARQLLRDDLSFKGPIDTFHRADDYVVAIKKLHGMVKGGDVKKLFVDGNDVCVLYDMITSTSAGTALISEWLHVEGGNISEIPHRNHAYDLFYSHLHMVLRFQPVPAAEQEIRRCLVELLSRAQSPAFRPRISP
jgi:hypothetical protein